MVTGTGRPTESKGTDITVDVIRKCRQESTGHCIEIRPDYEGFDFVEIVKFVDGKESQIIALTPEMAVAVAMAMLDCAEEITAKEVKSES
jgi:preprotein translocase subunit Sec61beta